MGYFDVILDKSGRQLAEALTAASLDKLTAHMQQHRQSSPSTVVGKFSVLYRQLIKQQHQATRPNDQNLAAMLEGNKGDVKVVWGDCADVLRKTKLESVQLIVTSPPYYNAREYSQWDNLDMYLEDMATIIREAWHVLDNHRAFVLNVGDITGNDHRHTKSSWGNRRIPLGAYFTQIFEDAGFAFVDDIIWDKGQVQSQRHKNPPHPLYQYPLNCYEHILVFFKHRDDPTKYPCPLCGCLVLNNNSYQRIGVQSWECKNPDCFRRSEAGRGKRFSLRSIIMDEMRQSCPIPETDVSKWRRDIVEIPPVIKINSRGENTLGHTAPFPKEIPEFATKAFSSENEVVLDPWAGSFTTPIVAAQLGRTGVGIEINETMFGDAIRDNIGKHSLAHTEHRA